jgi:hypothetical protein
LQAEDEVLSDVSSFEEDSCFQNSFWKQKIAYGHDTEKQDNKQQYGKNQSFS